MWSPAKDLRGTQVDDPFLRLSLPLTDLNPAEIFLPSYVDCEYTPLENRREPVHEITLTDEEIKNMFPQ